MVLVFWHSMEKRVTNSFPHNQIHLCIKDAKRCCQEKNNFYCSPQCFSVGHIVSHKHNIAYLFSNTVFIKTYVLNVFFFRYSIQQCMDIYGAQFNEENIQSGVTQTNTNYGGYGIAASKVSWHATQINWYLTHVCLIFPSGFRAPQRHQNSFSRILKEDHSWCYCGTNFEFHFLWPLCFGRRGC